MNDPSDPKNPREASPFLGHEDPAREVSRASVAVEKDAGRPARLVAKRPKRRRSPKHHTRRKVAFFHYHHYDVAFKFFTEQVLDAEFVALPPATRRSLEAGSRHSSDYVCAPFKHILGDYLDALELGADVLVQFAGPCRLGYYGELQESILRDMGYDFDMLNFSTLSGKPPLDYVRACKEKVNPNISLPAGVVNLAATAKMVRFLDEAYDYYLAHAAFAVEKGAFERTLADYYRAMGKVTCDREIVQVQRRAMAAFEAIPVEMPANRVRVGVVGEFFTAVDPHSNLEVEKKLIAMGVELHRMVNLTNRYLRYDEAELRQEAAPYVTYDMGPTSTMTCAAALRYARAAYDGLVHLKSSGCTPEIDCVPTLQRISSDLHIPVLYLSYDSQTSDTGLDTRLEAFYDMLAMKKESRS